jgi:hypothetical protein
MKMRVLSIDWDYFVEEDPMLDWGHRESQLFLEVIWSTRRTKHRFSKDGNSVVVEPVDLTKLVPFRGSEAFLMALAFRWPVYQIAVAESHLAILQDLENEDNIEIINIDAHHDIFYGTPPEKREHVNCGDWGSWLITNGRIKSWRQVYPAWRKMPHYGEEFPRKFARQNCRVSVEYGEPRITWKNVDLVFLCRSGCWAPPEYDERFNRLCLAMGAEKGLPVRKIEGTIEKPFEMSALAGLEFSQ